MFGRGVCAAALGVWLAAVIGLRAATGDVSTGDVVLDDGTPGILHLPDPIGSGALPVAILAHDFAGNAGQMGSLARQLARSGWAALALDLRGHGRNPSAWDFDGANRALARELEAALDWASSRPGQLDPQRVALVGHGIGAWAALQQAQWNPAELAAVVALAPPRDAPGPYSPPNVLVLWGTWDLPATREAGRAIGARLAAREQVVGGRTYGDAERGSALRIDELSGLGHWSLLWSDETAARAIEWLAPLAPAPMPGAAERTWLWAALGWAAALAMISALPKALRGLWPPDLATSPSPGAGVATVSVALFAAYALLCDLDPAGIGRPLPLAGARAPLALLGLSGLVALALLRGRWRGAALARVSTWLGGGALALALYVLLGPLLAPWLDPWISARRVPAVALAATAALPHFAALELLLRARGWWGTALPVLARLLAVLLLGAATLGGWLPEPALSGARYLALGIPVLELLAWRCASCAPNPWVSAIAQSLWVGWVFGGLFPLDG